jgi:type II secretory pathway pseudopilin PulG
MNGHALTILVVLAVVAFLLVLAIILARRSKQRRSERLRDRFGPEYHRVVAEHQDQALAEKALEEREKRSLRIIIRPLSREDRERYARAWRTVQARL